MSTVTIETTDFFSYADQSEADTYLIASTDFATWDENDSNTKGRFLVSATRLIDSLSFKTEYDTQVEREAIEDIHTATILIANSASNGNTAIFGSELSAPEQKMLKADTVAIQFFRNFNSASFTGQSVFTNFPNSVRTILKPYLKSLTSVSGANSFGTDGESQADDDYGVLPRV